MRYALKVLSETATKLQKLLERIQKGEKLGKREQNVIEHIIRDLQTTKRAMEEDLKPPAPRTLDTSIDWVTGRSKDGTYMALMTADKKLLRTIYITDEILKKIPEYEVTSEPIEMTMNKIQLSIPSIDFLKGVPKKATVFAIITKNGEQVKVLK